MGDEMGLGLDSPPRSLAPDCSSDGSQKRKSFTEFLFEAPQPLPEVIVEPCQPQMMHGQLYVQFTREEIGRLSEPFRFTIVLKFLHSWPSVDAIRWHIQTCWGLKYVPVIGVTRDPKQVLVRMLSEEDFVTGMVREVREIEGHHFRISRWTHKFSTKHDSPVIPVWVCLPDLPVLYFQETALARVVAGLGRYLRRDNATRCVTRPYEARVCIDMDVSKPPLMSFWIGPPGDPESHFQEVIYENWTSYCVRCQHLGHSVKFCRIGEVSKIPDGQMQNDNVRSSAAVVVQPPIADANKQVLFVVSGQASQHAKRKKGKEKLIYGSIKKKHLWHFTHRRKLVYRVKTKPIVDASSPNFELHESFTKAGESSIRQSQSLYSVYNTLNSQLAAAQRLFECLSNQMAVLNLNSPSVKQKNVAKELFESIGLTHGDSAFQSPDFNALGLTPDYKRVSLSPSRTIKEHPRRNISSALKNSEPETARRRRDSLDRSLAGFEPQKTTVKRMLQGHFRASVDKPLRITKEAFASQMDGFSVVQPKSNEIPAFSSSQSLMNKFQSDTYPPSKGILEKPSKAFESLSNSVFRWAKEPSSYSLSLESKSHPMQVSDGITQQSLSLETSSSLHSSVQSDTENSSIPDMSSTGVTRLGSQSNSSVMRPVTISKMISNMHLGTSIPSLASSNVSSSVSPKMTTLTTKGSASEQLNVNVGEDGLTRSLQKLTKELAVSPEGLSAISDESNTSSLSSTSTVSSAGLNRNADQVDGIANKNQPIAVSAPSKISVSDTSFLPTSSASPTLSIFSTSVTPSLPSPLFTPVAFGGSSLNSKPIEQTYEATSVFSSTLTASSQSILSSSSPSSFQFQISPVSTSPVESAISQPLSSHTIDVSSRTMLIPAQAPSSESSLHQSEINSKLKPDTSQVPAGEVSDEFASKSEPSLLSTNIGSMFPATSNSAPEMPSAMAPILTVTTTEKDEGLDINASQEEDVEEAAPETTAVLILGALGGLGLGSTPQSSVPKSNPFGGSFVTATASSANSLLSHTASPGELFCPASFSFPSAPPVQQTQAINSCGLGGGFSGFGQPAQLGSGQQALGSVLGSFGQLRPLNTGVPGFGLASSGGFGGGGFSASANHGGFASAGGSIGAASSGGFAGAAKGVGFGTVLSSGGGFAGAANGGGFAAAASGGGFAGITSASGGFGRGASSGFAAGGFGAFSSNQGGGFSAFDNSVTGAGKPPAELFTRMRK